jgi:hypothetical protein
MGTVPVAPNPIDAACSAVVGFRNKPLLVMFYPFRAMISELDIDDTYQVLRRGGYTKENHLPDLDLLVHTSGGDPVAAYRIAQLIRSMTQKLTVLVPCNAYSAGTLLSFAGNQIRFGDYAGLSPIDITIFEGRSRARSEGVELAAVDSFMEFAKGARTKIERALEEIGGKNSTSSVDSDLLVQMVKEVGALRVGKYYRERSLTGHYAQILLDMYMFAEVSDGKDRRNDVIRDFLYGAPAHEFHLDFHLCRNWRLNVERMKTTESDVTKQVVDTLDAATDEGLICRKLNRDIRMPFIHFCEAPKPKPHPTKGGSNVSRKTVK